MKINCAYTDLLKLENIIPHPKNRNKHSKKQIEVLAKIISKTGQRAPIVVSKRSGYVSKGHGRLEAIKLLGWDKCAVDRQDYESEEEELRDRVADNEIARYAEFNNLEFINDLKELNIEIEDIDFESFGLIANDFKNSDDSDIFDESSKPNIEFNKLLFLFEDNKTYNYVADMFKDQRTALEKGYELWKILKK